MKKYFVYTSTIWILFNLFLAIKDIGKTYENTPNEWWLPFLVGGYVLFTMWLGYGIGKTKNN